jgi:hypothetical protein
MLHYADNSWGIARDSVCVGVWEPTEKEECLDAFARMAGLDGISVFQLVH